MQKLAVLFIIYLFLISVSAVIGYAVFLALPAYANITAAALLILSSLFALYTFFAHIAGDE